MGLSGTETFIYIYLIQEHPSHPAQVYYLYTSRGKGLHPKRRLNGSIYYLEYNKMNNNRQALIIKYIIPNTMLCVCV